MREDLIHFIRCPICKEQNFEVVSSLRDSREIREGHLICQQCESVYKIERGIVDLLPNPTETILKEEQGWVELLGETSDELIDTMLSLPYYDQDPMWINVGHNFDRGLADVNVAGKSILDLGAGRCWSSRRLLQRGAAHVIALDILTTRYIGLETADIFFEHDGLYFERLVGDMNDLPLQDGKFDVVFSTATIHHSSNLECTFKEIARVLAPGGVALIINEPVRRIGSRENLSESVEVQHGINEHTYTIADYLSAVRSAGLRSELLFPGSVASWIQEGNWTIVRDHMGSVGARIIPRVWKYTRRLLQWQPLLWTIYAFSPAFPLVMIAQSRKETRDDLSQ